MRIAFLACLVLLSGCGCSPFDFVSPDPEPAEDAGELDFDCYSLDLPDAASVRAADVALGPFADGVLDLPLSPVGCFRVRREVSGGQLVSLTITRDLGPDFDGMTGAIGEPRIVVLARADRQPDGSRSTFVDGDPDGDELADDFYEYEERLDPARGRLERITYNPASRGVVERVVLERQPDGSFRETREALRDGALTEVSSFVVTSANEQQGPPGDCVERDCTPDEENTLEEASRDALTTSWGCLSDGGNNPGNERARKFIELMLRWASGHQFRCAIGCAYSGKWCSECQANGETLEMAIDPTLSAASLRSTLGHEWAHGYAGLHDTSILSLIEQTRTSYKAHLMLEAADPAYACEAYCFGGRVTACTCARCLGVTVCDPPCRDLPSCVQYDSVIMEFESSEAVGAACEPLIGDATWHADMATCESDCTFGSCKSYSLSCDPTCK